MTKKRRNLDEKLSKLFKAFLGNFKFAHQFRSKVQCCVIIILIPKISRLISLTYLWNKTFMLTFTLLTCKKRHLSSDVSLLKHYLMCHVSTRMRIAWNTKTRRSMSSVLNPFSSTVGLGFKLFFSTIWASFAFQC